MSYSPKTWVNGETIYATSLNNIENGIAANDSGIADLNEALTDEINYTSNLINNIVQTNLYKGTVEWLGEWINESVGWSDDGYYKGLKVKKRTGSWSGLFKLLNVESGKTYTFYAYAKAGIYANVTVNLLSTLSGYETTASVDIDTKSVLLNGEEWTEVYITFTCTHSGTVAPRVEANSSFALSVAGYRLIEGSYDGYKLENIAGDVKDFNNTLLNKADSKMLAFELGSLNATTGAEEAWSNRIRSNFIKLKKGTKISVSSGIKYMVFYYSHADLSTYLLRDGFRTIDLYIDKECYCKIVMAFSTN